MDPHAIGLRVLAALAVLGAGGAVAAQQARQQMSVERAEAAIDKAALQRKVTLDAAAKRTLALELVRQEAARPHVTNAPAPDARAGEMLKPFTPTAAATAISAEQARTTISSAKAAQLAAMLDTQIDAHAHATKRTIEPATREMIKIDLQKQIDGLSRSGLPADIIQQRNQAYLQAINAGVVEAGALTPGTYQTRRQAIFARLVNVSIETEPTGAVVTLDGSVIGPTSIVKKPFEPGKEYRLGFALDGYEAVTRTIYISPAVDQDVKEVLSPAQGQAPAGGSTAEPPARSFPIYLVMFLVAGLLALIVVAVRMKR